MTIPTQYFVFIFLFVAHYILTSIFPTIHMVCLFGGMINILINIQYINPSPISRQVLKLKTENDQHHSDSTMIEPTMSIQFHNLYRGFKYGVSGYVITIAIMPYYIYLFVNPGENFESFKMETISTCMKIFNYVKTTFT
jgi:hypothetical protein